MAAQQRAGGALDVAEIRGSAVFSEWGSTGSMASVLTEGLAHISSLTVKFTSSFFKFVLQAMHTIKF